MGAHLCGSRITDIQQLSSKWEDTVVVTANYTQTAYGKGLSRVPLSENEGALLGLLASSIVRIVELWNTCMSQQH